MTSLAAIAVAALAAAGAVHRFMRRGLERVSIDLSGVDVTTATGEPVRLGSLVQRPTILVLPRYYG